MKFKSKKIIKPQTTKKIYVYFSYQCLRLIKTKNYKIKKRAKSGFHVYVIMRTFNVFDPIKTYKTVELV